MNEENSNILKKCGLLLKYYNIFIGKYQILWRPVHPYS